MNKPENMEELCYIQLPCPYCGMVCSGGYHPFGGWSTSKGVLANHLRKCEMNPDSIENKKIRATNKLISAMEICKTQAKISECLNCQHFQHECEGLDINKINKSHRKNKKK